MPRLRDIPKFIDGGDYSCDIPWDHLKEWIVRHEEYPGVDMDPDFQRAHVWTRDKQIAFVEFIIRCGRSASGIWWNCPSWSNGPQTPMVLVDGKPSAYISQTMLQQLHDREGGVQQLYPAVGVIRSAPHVTEPPF